ncbi:MAG: protein kinase [Pirellulales bacterium]
MNELDLFAAAILVANPVERAALLDRECAGRPEMRDRIQQLLEAHARPHSVLDQPAAGPKDYGDGDAATTSHSDRSEQAGQVIAGKYTLVDVVGEGGMGAVWRAKQTAPVKRYVAVKLIKAGMDSKQVVARFEAERQALALMDHPSIAKVLDGGLHDRRPFFVMELVKGVPITEYCDKCRLAPSQRLELFVSVCHAIQHAHQKGIIHRDIKPSNVLVAMYDDKPVVKVIDFGVAKATGGTLTEATFDTGIASVVGTPLYMSPEQATFNNLDIDTRSDVYSLGALLYELLTGSPPFSKNELEKRGLLEILRVVREVEPPRPSTKVSTADALPTLSANRGTEPSKLTNLLRNELDWIVMKALEKDRARRYETANGFAADIQRYLSGEAVTAHPPSAVYRLRKFMRRYRMQVAAAFLLITTLIAGVIGTTWQSIRAERAAREATRALEELRSTAPAFVEQARALAAKEQFPEAMEKLEYAIRLRPEEALYHVAKANLLQCQLRLPEAKAAYETALELNAEESDALAGQKLCEELLAGAIGPDGKLTREGLVTLHLSMQKQQRPAAEIMPVARLLGRENETLLAYWLERMKDLPISADKPLKDRLTLRDDGRLALDLSDTKVSSLAPLTGCPLASLNLMGTTELSSLEQLRGMKLLGLSISQTKLKDLSPLAGMDSLRSLIAVGSQVSDLSPLRGLPLRMVMLNNCPVTDLSPLQGAPIETLHLRETRVVNIEPLRGMPLTELDLTSTPVKDFTPLADLPLKTLHLQQSRLVDLTFLSRLPLQELNLWGCHDARNYAALAELKSLELLVLPNSIDTLPLEEQEAISKLRLNPKLRQLEASITNQMELGATGPAEKFWAEWDKRMQWFAPLRKAGIRFSWRQRSEGDGYSLVIESQPEFRDLSLLSGLKEAPIVGLWVTDCGVTDVAPIRDLPLKVLVLRGNPISDLTSLRSMIRLEHLGVDGTKVTDVGPLADLPSLKWLYTHDCLELRSVAALAKVTSLEEVTLPWSATEVETLRALPHLKWIGCGLGQEFDASGRLRPPSTAEVFWADFERTKRLREWAAGPTVLVRRLRQLPDGMWDLDLSNSSFTDLTPLRDMPIAELWLSDTKVADLSPLKGIKLRKLHLFRTGVTDLRPLEGMPLTFLNLVSTKVQDISPLAGMPLEDVKLDDCNELTDVSPLKQCPTLRQVVLPRRAKDFEFLRSFPYIERLSYDEDDNNGWRASLTAAEFWGVYDRLRKISTECSLPDFDPTRWRYLRDGTYNIDLSHTSLTSLVPLKVLPVSELGIEGTQVSDLTPLEGMPLRNLRIGSTKIVDLRPLANLPLETLNLVGTPITDIQPLAGLPLKRLFLGGCESLTELSPLNEIKSLEQLTLPPNAKEIEFLRSMPQLRRLSFHQDPNHNWDPDKSVEEFWQGWDAKKLR